MARKRMTRQDARKRIEWKCMLRSLLDRRSGLALQKVADAINKESDERDNWANPRLIAAYRVLPPDNVLGWADERVSNRPGKIDLRVPASEERLKAMISAFGAQLKIWKDDDPLAEKERNKFWSLLFGDESMPPARGLRGVRGGSIYDDANEVRRFLQKCSDGGYAKELVIIAYSAVEYQLDVTDGPEILPIVRELLNKGARIVYVVDDQWIAWPAGAVLARLRLAYDPLRTGVPIDDLSGLYTLRIPKAIIPSLTSLIGRMGIVCRVQASSVKKVAEEPLKISSFAECSIEGVWFSITGPISDGRRATTTRWVLVHAPDDFKREFFDFLGRCGEAVKEHEEEDIIQPLFPSDRRITDDS